LAVSGCWSFGVFPSFLKVRTSDRVPRPGRLPRVPVSVIEILRSPITPLSLSKNDPAFCSTAYWTSALVVMSDVSGLVFFPER